MNHELSRLVDQLRHFAQDRAAALHKFRPDSWIAGTYSGQVQAYNFAADWIEEILVTGQSIPETSLN